MAAIEVPRIDGPWRALFVPSRYGRYVNDHSLIRGADGAWHLFGITSHAEEDFSERERYFVHARGASLDGPMEEVGKGCDIGVRAWAPGVIAHGGRYYMYYGPSPTRFATSDELGHWMENEVELRDAPLDAAHRDHFVLEVEPGRWLMYATGIAERMGVVPVFESDDLRVWRFVRYALRTAGAAPLRPPWGATESPGVVARGIGLFSGRVYNIDSLTVAEVDQDGHLSRITIVTTGTPQVIEQIKTQLGRIVSVHDVHDLTVEGASVERELAILKVVGTGDKRVEALRLADIFRASVVDSTLESFVFEITGAPDKIDKFSELMRPLGLAEIARTGVAALSRGT